MSEPTVGKFLDNVWNAIVGIGIVFFVIFVLARINGPSSRGLNVGGIEAGFNSVTFDMANTSSKSGDVLVWVEQAGIRKCERIFRMKANVRVTNISFSCNIETGVFKLRGAWASSMSDRASVARRVNINY